MEQYNNLLNKRVRVLTDTLKAPDDYGILTRIDNGRYPFIIKFDSGSEYGVGNIEAIEDDNLATSVEPNSCYEDRIERGEDDEEYFEDYDDY